MKKNKINEYKKLFLELWNALEDELITKDEYFDRKHKWLMENGSEELFDYFINLYKGRPIEKEYINFKNEFRKLTAADQVEQMFKRLNLKARYVDKSGCCSLLTNHNKKKI